MQTISCVRGPREQLQGSVDEGESSKISRNGRQNMLSDLTAVFALFSPDKKRNEKKAERLELGSCWAQFYNCTVDI